MTIGIIGAMAPEVDTLVARLQRPQCIDCGLVKIHTGKLAGKDAAVCRCGIGKVCAGAVTALLIEVAHAQAVINTGCAGALDPDLRLGDTVIGDRVAHHDVDTTVFGDAVGQLPGHERFFIADPALVAAARRAGARLPDTAPSLRCGLILSGDQFISSPQRKAALRAEFPGAQVTEMEGAAVAQVASDCKCPFIVIRAVSDQAEEGQSTTFAEFMPAAADRSARLVLAMLAEL